MQGEVEAFAIVKPTYLRLTGKAGDKVAGKVLIEPAEKYSFKIVDAKPLKGDNISVTLEENAQEGKGYLLTVENKLAQQGHYYDAIHLKTDSKIKPEISVRVYGNIYERPNKTGEPQTPATN